MKVDAVIWQFNTDYGTNVTDNDQELPIKDVYIKTHDDIYWMNVFDRHPLAISGPDALKRVVSIYAAQNIGVYAWCVPKSRNIEQQIALALQVLDVDGVKGLLWDVEPYTGFCADNCRFLADTYAVQIRDARPDAFLGTIYDPRPQHWASSGTSQWLAVSDAAMPMVYWEDFLGQGEWGNPVTSVLRAAQDVPSGKLYIPMLPGNTSPVNMVLALDTAKQVNAAGISLWRRGTTRPETWQAIAEYEGGASSMTPEERARLERLERIVGGYKFTDGEGNVLRGEEALAYIDKVLNLSLAEANNSSALEFKAIKERLTALESINKDEIAKEAAQLLYERLLAALERK